MGDEYLGPANLIIVGAGATAALGFPCTSQQEEALRSAAEISHGQDKDRNYYRQVAICLLYSVSGIAWLVDALADLIELVDYEDELQCYDNVPNQRQLELLGKNAPECWKERDSRKLFFYLREHFSWDVLKKTVLGCPHSVEFIKECPFHINDLYNLFDFHSRKKHGIQLQKNAVSPDELDKARQLLLIIQYIQIYAGWQYAINKKPEVLTQYYDLAKVLGMEMLEEGFQLLRDDPTLKMNDKRFYLMSYGVISMNYDPVSLMMIMCAHNDLNKQPPYIGTPPQKLKLFNDFSYFMSTSRLKQIEDNTNDTKGVWFPMNEPGAQRLNDPDHVSRRVRIGKFLMTHGMVGMRECRNCGMVTNYLGEEWRYNSPDMILPPMLNAFRPPNSKRQPTRGSNGCLRPDQIYCAHCNEILGMEDLRMEPQSSFKSNSSPVLEEIGRDMSVQLMACKHVILFGYSLPRDDVEFRAILSARLSSPLTDGADRPKCSVVVGRQGDACWIYGRELQKALNNGKIKDRSARETILQAISIFGLEQVRYFGGGIPTVFTGNSNKTDPKLVKSLLNWDISAL